MTGSMDGRIAGVFQDHGGLIIVINRGIREKIMKKMIYAICDTNDQIVALLIVQEVREKISLTRPIWVYNNCPFIKYGDKVKMVNNGQ